METTPSPSGNRSFFSRGPFRSLRGRLVLLFVVGAVVPLLVVGSLSYRKATRALERAAGDSLANLAAGVADAVDRNLFERYGDVQAFARSEAARSMEPRQLVDWMNAMMQTYDPIYSLMAVATPDGRIVAVNTVDGAGRPVPNGALVGFDVSRRDWFRACASGQVPAGTARVDETRDDELLSARAGGGKKVRSVIFSTPIRDAAGAIVGIWSNRLDWRVVETLQADQLGRAKGDRASAMALVLVGKDGTVLSSTSPDIASRGTIGQFEVARRAVVRGARGWLRERGLSAEGSDEMVGYSRAEGYASWEGLGWAVLASQEAREALAASRGLARWSLLLFLGTVVVVAASALLIARAILGPLREIETSVHGLVASEADLTHRLPAGGEDEIGRLAAHFNEFMDRLEAVIRQVLRSGIQVTTSTTQIAAGAKQLEATVTEQVAATNEVVASAREISATAQELTKTMNLVSHLSEAAASSAAIGQRDLHQMESSMGLMEEASRAVSTKLAVINEKAGNISTVVTTITKVADQTNLLSLNAAIEAEKAGQYGQGFAVVAREIRRLADQTAVATLDIEKMVREMKTAVSSGVMTMDKFSDQVRQAVAAVQQVGAQLALIIDQIQQVTPRFEAVHQGMEAQSLGAQQISETMSQLSETTQQTAHALRETKRAVEELNQAAGGLQQTFSRFRLAS